MTRVTNTDERRGQIADALGRVVARVGYERASVQEIAREAGLAAGLVHYHFRRKLDVLLALQERLVVRHRARIERRLAAAKGPRERIEAFVDAHLGRGAEEDPEALACWIALTAEALRDPEVRAGYDRAVRSLVALLDADVAAVLGVPEGTPRSLAVATALFAAIQGYYALHGASAELIPRGSAAPSVHRYARALLDLHEGATP